MSMNKLQAYQQTQRANLENLGPREVEAMAFTKAAVMLEDARNNPGDSAGFTQALRFNHLLWTIIQADLTDEANQLPDAIKANVMSLSIFVDKQTTRAMRSQKADDLSVLIEINRNLAGGLRTRPPSP